MRTTVQSIRFPHPLWDRIKSVAELKNSTGADVVRDALGEYFERQKTSAEIAAMESRLVSKMDEQTQQITTGLKQLKDTANGNSEKRP